MTVLVQQFGFRTEIPETVLTQYSTGFTPLKTTLLKI